MAARLTTYVVVAIVAATLIAGLIVGAQRDDSSGPVDLIVHNAKVYAADDLGSIADAVAIRGNTILHVGSEREIMRYRRPQTTVLDARGAAVLPGFVDAHASLIAGGLARNSVQLFDAASLEDIQQRAGAWADAHPDSDWITGGGWSYDVLADQPARGLLDAAVNDRPVALRSRDGHALWVNTKALEIAGVTRRTANPKNGFIVRDRRGDATGLLKDDATALVERAIPAPTREERARALQLAILAARQHGITSVHDFGSAPDDLALYEAARKAGTLGVRVYAGMPATRVAPQEIDAIAARYPDDPLLKAGLATIDLDGSVESQTAAMLASYAPRAGGQGFSRLPPARLLALVESLDAAGRQIAIEAGGDAAVREALDVYESAARQRTRPGASRHRIENLEIVDPDDIARVARLHVTASMWPLGSAGELLAWSKAVGPERAPFGWPARSVAGTGARLAFGSDWPNLPLDPLASIAAAVNRTAPASALAAEHAPEQLTLKSAINAWTSGAAWASFDELRKGSIRAGMLADLVVLSTDIFRSPARVATAQVAITIFDGKVVYRRASS